MPSPIARERRFEEAALELRERGVSSVLDLGIMVGTPREFARGVRFDVDVSLEVTAYPWREDRGTRAARQLGRTGGTGARRECPLREGVAQPRAAQGGHSGHART